MYFPLPLLVVLCSLFLGALSLPSSFDLVNGQSKFLLNRDGQRVKRQAEPDEEQPAEPANQEGDEPLPEASNQEKPQEGDGALTEVPNQEEPQEGDDLNNDKEEEKDLSGEGNNDPAEDKENPDQGTSFFRLVVISS
jgi:FtsZ-interacting cell division protein ZipA